MMIHGVMGQIQGAINYAEKLNQSLNNIQIITGQNNEKMAEFARQANQTARQLSTTTTEYTNASLIYYQQGLNDKQVAERTETTLKLANVTRQSAQEVSNELTAIWNNFDDGTTMLLLLQVQQLLQVPPKLQMVFKNLLLQQKQQD